MYRLSSLKKKKLVLSIIKMGYRKERPKDGRKKVYPIIFASVELHRKRDPIMPVAKCLCC